jgi:hypothetical protein
MRPATPSLMPTSSMPGALIHELRLVEPMWLELTKASSINGADHKTFINFALVIEMEWIASRKVTALHFMAGFQVEVKENPDAIFLLLERGVQ